MSTPLICFILIGPPNCGKTALAQAIAQYRPEYQIISLSQSKQKPAGQSERLTPLSKALQQIRAALQTSQPIIYDAENCKRADRLQLLQVLTQLQQELSLDIYWVGLEVQVDCTAEERKNSPTLTELHHFRPCTAEGFTKIWQISPAIEESGQPDFQILTTGRKKALISLIEFLEYDSIYNAIQRSQINEANRKSEVRYHAYSRLQDFERLMHLIALMINYPGIGHLQDTAPQQLQELLDTTQTPEFKTSLDEICGILAHHQGMVYADPEKISLDLQFLEHNDFFKSNSETLQIEIPQVEDSSGNPALSSHYASDLDIFKRLMQTLRVLAHQPFLCSQLSDEESRGMQKILLEEINRSAFLATSDSIRKDIEQIYKPYKILPNRTMRKGYFLGTGILASHELKEVYKVLQSQAKNLKDPVALGIYNTFKDRMKESGILDNSKLTELYPVRAIANRSIVDIDSLPQRGAFNNLQGLEAAIECGQQVELARFDWAAKHYNDPLPPDTFTALPLQIVFHAIGWYLGFKTTDNQNRPLYKFERLDRLVWKRKVGSPQGEKTARNCLKELEALYKSGIGIFVGYDSETQQKFLSKDKATQRSVMITLEIWCTEHIFQFIAEGNNRFPAGQVTMTKPKSSRGCDENLFKLPISKDVRYPNRFQVKLPVWALKDTDLIRWIVGFGNEVKVVTPPEMVTIFQEFSTKLAAVYPNLA
jgi:hypothetical protein